MKRRERITHPSRGPCTPDASGAEPPRPSSSRATRRRSDSCEDDGRAASSSHPASAGLEPLLTVEDCARILNFSDRHTRRLIDAGELETIRIGRAVRVAPDALRALIARARRP